MKQIPDFKVGDTVYDEVRFPGRKGFIESIIHDKVNVRFEGKPCLEYYLSNGCCKSSPFSIPTLSHTSYDLVNGGFSQKMKLNLPEIEVDRVVYVRIHGRWQMRYFSHFNNEGEICCFVDQKTSEETTLTDVWKEWSLTNPLEK